MKYAMLVYGDDSAWVDLSEDEKAELRAQEMPRWITLFDELQKADPNLAGYELDGRDTAKVVRVRNGERIVTDGPFAEAKELVGGYWVIQVKSKEEAVEWASRCPGGDGDVIEVRQVFEMSDFPEDVQQAANEADVNPSAQPTER